MAERFLTRKNVLRSSIAGIVLGVAAFGAEALPVFTSSSPADKVSTSDHKKDNLSGQEKAVLTGGALIAGLGAIGVMAATNRSFPQITEWDREEFEAKDLLRFKL